MEIIQIEDTEYKIPTDWDELNWPVWINLLNLEDKRDTYIVDMIYAQRYLEILAGVSEGVFDEMECVEMSRLEEIVMKTFDPKTLNNITACTDHFVINGVTYSFYSPNTIGNIKIGEQGYIEMLKQHNKEPFDHLLKSLAVLIRPADRVVTKEGLVKWKLDRFDTDDVEHRAKILSDNMRLKDLIMIYNFFLNGSNM